jgi:Right handed beta helix region
MRKILIALAALAASWLTSTQTSVAASCNTVPCPVAWVQMNGLSIANNGANACVLSPSQGCSTFADALTSVTAGGTIVILDNGDYAESVGVNKSVTITGALKPTIAPPNGTPALLINTAGVSVEIDGLILDGVSGGTFGVNLTNGSFLRVANSIIKNFNGGGISGAINVKPAAAVTTKVSIENSSLRNNSFGIVADGTSNGIVRGVVRDTVVSNNTSNGITVSTSSSNVVLAVENTTVSGNNFGLVAGGAAAGMLVSNATVANNANGLFSTGSGALLSYGNNKVNGNTSADGVFTGAVGPK